MKKRFVCVWNEPTYDENIGIEGEELFDKNRGFNNAERAAFDTLEIDEILRLQDLVVIRIK